MRKAEAPAKSPKEPAQANTMTIGGQTYKRVSADQASWLR